MKRFIVFGFMIALSACLYAQTDITDGGTIAIQGVPNDGVSTGDNHGWPAAEAPQYAFDNNSGTKFLHFKGEIQPTGIRVTPTRTQTIAGGMTFTTANDAEARDPISWELYGSNDSINGPWTLIAEGTIFDFRQATPWARNTKGTTQIVFANTVAYDHYQVMFPAIRHSIYPGGANSMQIAEIEIIEMPEEGWDLPPSIDAGPDQFVLLSDSPIQTAATVSDSHIPNDQLTYQWLHHSGPAPVSFNGTQNQLVAEVAFPEGGVYELELRVKDQHNHDVNDIVQYRVWDSVKDDALVGHWKFNEGSGTTAFDSSGNNNKGLFGFTANVDETTPAPSAPTFAAGWIPSEAPNNYGVKFGNGGYVQIKTDPNFAEGDLNNIKWRITISAWMKADDYLRANGEFANRRILQKGASDNQFRLLAEWGNLVFHLANVGRLETPLPTTGAWHHIAGVYDGSAMKMYVDGWLAGSIPASGEIGITQDPLFLGTKSNTVTVAGDYFKGMLDDLRIYNYPLTEAQVQDLARMGENVPPVVSVVDPADLVLSVRKFIQMEATAIDLNDDDTINYKWTASDPSITFDPSDSVVDPKAVFTKDGTFTLRLTVNDGKSGLDNSIFSEVSVVVTNPTCADVVAIPDMVLFGDYNKDCHVTLADFAEFAANWLKCNDPRDPTCENPFE
ncbi:MAG: LamG domain-containing protein [Phycisphaerae bacterium]|nr:LamG domain-containing protein [Phycisphaerae bacterium]